MSEIPLFPYGYGGLKVANSTIIVVQWRIKIRRGKYMDKWRKEGDKV